MARDKGLVDCGPVVYEPQEEASSGRADVEAVLRAIPGVEGVGEGRNQIGEPAWIAYVRDRSVLAQLPATLNGRAVVPQVTGEIDILPA